jgi:hypothetical protein
MLAAIFTTLSLALMSGPVHAAGAEAHEYAIVVSPDVDVTTLTVPEIRRIFMLERRFWKSGRPIVTLMPSNGTAPRTYLLGKICGTDDARYRQMLLERMYRGEIDLAPKVVDSDVDMVSFVAASHGLIAIVPASVADTARVRVLAVAGKPPGVAGYPLKD